MRTGRTFGRTGTCCGASAFSSFFFAASSSEEQPSSALFALGLAEFLFGHERVSSWEILFPIQYRLRMMTRHRFLCLNLQ